MTSTSTLLSDYTPTDRLDEAWTLPARWYTDPALLALEKERIFYRTWQWVGSTALVQRPGDFFTYDLYGEPLVITRGQDGALRGFHNVCLHRRAGGGGQGQPQVAAMPLSRLDICARWTTAQCAGVRGRAQLVA